MTLSTPRFEVNATVFVDACTSSVTRSVPSVYVPDLTGSTLSPA
jgi:hypothetical protein